MKHTQNVSLKKKQQNSRLMCVTVDSTILTFYLQCKCTFYSDVTVATGLINLYNVVTAPIFVLRFFASFFPPISIDNLENRNRNSVQSFPQQHKRVQLFHRTDENFRSKKVFEGECT